MKEKTTIIKKWRFPQIHSRLWLLTLFTFLTSMSGWGWDIDYSPNENNVSNGKIHLCINGDEDDWPDCESDFLKNQFYTISFFNNALGRWCYEFYIHQYEPNAHDSEGKYNSIDSDIKVWIMTKDGKTNSLGTIENNANGNIKDAHTDYGTLKKKDGATGVYQYYPSTDVLLNPSKGFNGLKFNFKYNHNRNNKKDKEYEITMYKGLQEGMHFDFTPLPEAEVGPDKDGFLTFNANNVPGGANESYYKWQYMASNMDVYSQYYNLDITKCSTWNKDKQYNDISVTTDQLRLQPKYGYWICYNGIQKCSERKDEYINPYEGPDAPYGYYFSKLLPAYIYPQNLQTTGFNQWTKSVSISWSAVRGECPGYRGIYGERSSDGEWRLYRVWEKEAGVKDSTVVAKLSGNKSDAELHATDTPPEYDKTYTYRVVFVPTIYKDHDISWFDEDIQPSINVTTTRDVSIKLSQDKDPNIAGIKLDWTYNIQQSGSKFRVERRSGDGGWVTLNGSQQSVITSQTTASYIDETPANVCEFYDYRVVATTLDTEFNSNELLNCNLPAGTKILSIDATKGTEEKVVIVNWTVEQKGTNDTYFNIERRTITNNGSGDWVKVGEAHGTLSEYSYTDERVQAGSYYEYRVVAFGAQCEEQTVQSDEMTAIGFSQASGTITGHISYNGGNSVEGVHISLVKSGTDSNLQQFYSEYISGSGSALTWTPDSKRYGNVLNSNKPLSVQMWAAPISGKTYMPVFSLDGIIEVGLTENGNNYELCYKDQSGTQQNLKAKVRADQFSHITASYNGSNWTFYVNSGDSTQTATATNTQAWTFANDANRFRAGAATDGSNFSGIIDEVRFWNKALSADEVSTNYDRLLGGSENGLILYWPLDEGLNGYVFDISKQNGINNENHATIDANARPSKITPNELGLYGITDNDGNYIIKGVPFDAGGTNYKIVPEFGIHAFSPSSRNLYISPSSLTANHVDFNDESSFPMNGYIYYTNTNIPAKGIYFYIDGQLVTTGGEVAMTDDRGYYSISVPIGEHFVEAKQSGHTLIDGGRFPVRGTHDFQKAVQQNFSDSTVVNFCGRIAGGEIQENLPVGFGDISGSLNNIGTAVITLGLTNPNLSFNCEEGTAVNKSTTRSFYAQNPDTIKSTTWAGADASAGMIYIQTDAKTGEFSALLPPLKYTVMSIDVPKNPEVSFTSLPEINMTNPIAFKVDTLLDIHAQNESGEKLVIATYKYNEKMVKAWYCTPTLEVTDANDELNIGAFGVKDYYGYEDEYGTIDDIPVYEANGNKPHYFYDYPIYKMKDIYTYKIKGYEKYTNYDKGENALVYDILPMSNQVLTVENEMSSDQRIVVDPEEGSEMQEGQVYDLQANQLALDSIGEFTYQWTAGMPNTIEPYTRHVGITYNRHNRTYSWDGIDAMVFGTLPLGNNFVTKGPDNVLMVLRDPPGSKSYTTWTRGHANSDISMIRSNGFTADLNIMAEVLTGLSLTSGAGLGFVLVSTQEAEQIFHGGLSIGVSYNNTTSTTYTMSSTETISTSADKEYVGANGDTYIGVSTNLILGDCKKVGFFRDGPADDTFAVKDSMAVSVSDSVTTSFMYSQREIEKKQIPEWETMRSQLLIPVASKQEAENYPNPTNESLYVTWQPLDSEVWIPEETYMQIPPADGHAETDMVNYYTQQVKAWQQIMANNEKDKVNSMSSSSSLYSKKKNFSFDSGTSYSYSEKNDTVHTNMNQWDYSVILKGDANFGANFKSGAAFGLNLTIGGDFGYKGSSAWGNSDVNYENYAEFTYHLEDDNIGSDYTVDVFKSLSNWTDVFSVLGGQTYCPYEGEITSKYYEPGKHVLSNATEKMQNPQIFISDGKQAPSKNAVLNDVPTGQPAVFTLSLSNDAASDMDMTFVLEEDDSTNPDGLHFRIDGEPFSGGRSIIIPAGKTVTKTLEVMQTSTSVRNYEGVTLLFASECQDDPRSINGILNDKCSFNVFFKPSSSPVDLVADTTIVNTMTSGKLNLTLTNFNRSFQGLEKMGVEYKADYATNWALKQEYTFDEKKVTEDIPLVPEKGDITLEVDMNDNSAYPDGIYQFRAYTETPFGEEMVRVYSDEVTVVKDMIRPTALGTPQPTDGILHFGDDLMVEFNENIVPGYVNASNVLVTGKVNNQPTSHEVSMHLSGAEPTAQTETGLYMRGNSSMGMWLKYTKGGTIFRHCTGANALTLGIDDTGHLVLVIGNDSVVAESAVVPKEEWTYLTYSYDEQTTNVDLMLQYGTTNAKYNAVLGAGRSLQQVVYADDKRLFLGGDGLEGDIHDLCIYSIKRDVEDLASEKYDDKEIYRAGLMARWPMDEGQGTKARDLRNNAHPLILSAPNWHIDNDNNAVAVDAAKQEYLELDITPAITNENESYALEFWFRGDEDLTGKTIFQSGTDADNILRLYGNDTGELTLQYGVYLVPVTGTDFDATTGWHHFALNVQRGASASVMIDGKRTAVISEDDLPPVEGARLMLGAGFEIPLGNTYVFNSYMSGAFDEFRLWKGMLSSDFIKNNMYHEIDTTTAKQQGLVVYYPMGIKDAKEALVSGVENAMGTCTTNSAPLKSAPIMQTVISNATVSDRKIAITLQPTSLSEIEGTTLDITINKIFDENGNSSLPITWQALVHQNTLGWAKDSVNVIKNYGEEATFDVSIKNTGYMTEYFSVNNLPTWLTTEQNEGDLAPESEQIIRFRVNKNAAVGYYDANLSLTGNNGISEPLRIVMQVKGQAPDWTVDVDKYDDHMSMVAQVLINNVVSENTDSRLAAFIDNECVGVATPEKARNTFFLPMTIYGDAKKHTGKKVEFRYWDGATGITYTGMDAEPNIIFKKDSMKGSYSYPVLLTNKDEISQTMNLPAGWNWISFYVKPANGVEDIISVSGMTEGDAIKDRDHVSYYDGSGWSYGNMTSLHVGNMYKMNVQQPVNIEVRGASCNPAETPVNLDFGWNWIGYTPTSAMDVNEALSGTGAVEGDYVKSKTAFAIYGPYGWEGNLKVLEPGKGYMMFTQVMGSHTFVYPNVTPNNSKGYLAAPMKSEDYHFTPKNSNIYPDNMSIVVKLVYDAQAVDTAEVAAFINDECRATAKATNGLYYLMVHGEDGDGSIELRTIFNDKEIVIDRSLIFESDTNVGLPWNPYVIDLGNASGIWTIDSDNADDSDARFFLPNGIEVEKSAVHKGQVYIVKYGNGKTVKYRK